MGEHHAEGFAAKHGANAVADPVVRAEIEKRCDKRGLPCAVAFDIAAATQRAPREVGRTADLMNLRLIKCQLGLFGYGADKKIVKARAAEDDRLADAIRDAVVGERLPCRQAWEIAARFNLPKLAIGGVCEGLGVKIKPCQLGAF